mmetsp:Transcript_70065/g.150013  ORF Transcript_70065/g.150013 Transcript_70065/m.150013 type:complete len:392 (-) Transcript_70065:74-1249(-)
MPPPLEEAAALAWGQGKWPASKADGDWCGSHSSGGATRCPAAASDDGEDTWSRCDAGSSTDDEETTVQAIQESATASGRAGSVADAQDEEHRFPNLSSLQKDGAFANAASQGHPNSCTPCAFYCFSLRGCRNGDQCSYCHLFHESKGRRKQRCEDWKRRHRGKRGSQCEEAASLAPPTSRPERCMVPEKRGGAGAPVKRGGSAPEAKVAATSRCQGGEGGVRGGFERSGPSPQSQSLVPPAMAYSPSTRVLAQVNTAAAMAVSECGYHSENVESFAYQPHSTTVLVGHWVDLWPPGELATGKFAFAVSPPLPLGLELDERLGFIRGRAQEATEGAAMHFVTACSPDLRVKIAMVTIEVVDHLRHQQISRASLARQHSTLRKMTRVVAHFEA